MKKILNILSTITLSTIITTNIIACNTPNENNEPNKQIEKKFIAQQPPKNNNWKLVTDYNSFVSNINNKFYFFVFKTFNNSKWKLLKFKHDTNNAKEINGIPFIPSDIKVYAESNRLKGLYQWNSVGNSPTPTINNNTGEITNWNEKIES